MAARRGAAQTKAEDAEVVEAPTEPEQKDPGKPGHRPDLAPGDQGEAVELVQSYLDITVDGQYGEDTEAAVRRLQMNHGRLITGRVTAEDWALIDQA